MSDLEGSHSVNLRLSPIGALSELQPPDLREARLARLALSRQEVAAPAQELAKLRQHIAAVSDQRSILHETAQRLVSEQAFPGKQFEQAAELLWRRMAVFAETLKDSQKLLPKGKDVLLAAPLEELQALLELIPLSGPIDPAAIQAGFKGALKKKGGVLASPLEAEGSRNVLDQLLGASQLVRAELQWIARRPILAALAHDGVDKLESAIRQAVNQYQNPVTQAGSTARNALWHALAYVFENPEEDNLRLISGQIVSLAADLQVSPEAQARGVHYDKTGLPEQLFKRIKDLGRQAYAQMGIEEEERGQLLRKLIDRSSQDGSVIERGTRVSTWVRTEIENRLITLARQKEAVLSRLTTQFTDRQLTNELSEMVKKGLISSSLAHRLRERTGIEYRFQEIDKRTIALQEVGIEDATICAAVVGQTLERGLKQPGFEIILKGWRNLVRDYVLLPATITAIFRELPGIFLHPETLKLALSRLAELSDDASVGITLVNHAPQLIIHFDPVFYDHLRAVLQVGRQVWAARPHLDPHKHPECYTSSQALHETEGLLRQSKPGAGPRSEPHKARHRR